MMSRLTPRKGEPLVDGAASADVAAVAGGTPPSSPARPAVGCAWAGTGVGGDWRLMELAEIMGVPFFLLPGMPETRPTLARKGYCHHLRVGRGGRMLVVMPWNVRHFKIPPWHLMDLLDILMPDRHRISGTHGRKPLE